MAGEVLKALIFRPKVGESGCDGRNARFSLGEARGQPLCIPNLDPPYRIAFILISARQPLNAEINGQHTCSLSSQTIQIAAGVNLIIWCYLGDQQLADADEQWRVSD